MDPFWLAIPGLVIWSAITVLPWRPCSTRESLDGTSTTSADLSHISVIIPARNEEVGITTTLNALAVQGQGLRILLVDDESDDRTVELANSLGLDGLTLIKGKELEPGWSGKLWALEQGLSQVETDYILLLDADIELKPGTVHALLNKMQEKDYQLVSLMAFLRMQSAWETLLMPAFIYFFKLLYPFHISNSESRLIAAAAGGCILTTTQTINNIGGFASLKSELIDDCALARRVKDSGSRTWIGLTHSAVSHRPYDDLTTIWNMVTRTAFIQLRYSRLLLLVCTILMLCAFLLPVITLCLQDTVAFVLALTSLVLMAISFLPTLKYYGVNQLLALTLPLTGMLYLMMTWNSAIKHWRGMGSSWKGRTYAG